MSQLRCDNCGGCKSRVIKTKSHTLLNADGSQRVIVLRRRECRFCGARFTTRETQQGDYKLAANTA